MNKGTTFIILLCMLLWSIIHDANTSQSIGIARGKISYRMIKRCCKLRTKLATCGRPSANTNRKSRKQCKRIRKRVNKCQKKNWNLVKCRLPTGWSPGGFIG